MEIESAVEKFILEEIMLADPGQKLAERDSLMDQGVLDSLGLLRLIAFLEEQFGIEVQDDEVTPENFESLTTIRKMVETKLS
jgi:acyl carrier protein